MKKAVRDNNTTWDELIDRYFEAVTTEEEEILLRRFLASAEGADRRYDDVRAVMGFLVTGKQLRKAASPRPVRLRLSAWRGVAAAAVLVVGFGVATLSRFALPEADVYVAYVGGERVTAPDAVLLQMQLSMQTVASPVGEPSVEQQLTEMFQLP